MSQRRAGKGSRAVVYVRVSSRGQDTLKEQEKRCRAFAASQGWTVVKAIAEKQSAWSGKDRPGWLQVEAMVDRREVDSVIVFQVSRAARNTERLAQFISRCEAADVVFATASDGVNTATAMGRLMAKIIGALAELESEIKSERITLKFDEKRAAGEWTGGRVPYGFRQKGTTLVVDEKEAARVREAATAVLAGTGLSTLARTWRQRGIKTKRGGTWGATTLRDILKDERHAGTTLTRSTHARVLKLINGRVGSVPRGDRYMLTGLLHCSVCDGPMAGQPKNGTRRYVCFAGAHNTVINADALEDLVTRRAAEAEKPEPESVPDPGEPLRAEVERIEKALEDLGDSDLSELVIRGREKKLLRELKAAQDAIEELPPGPSPEGWGEFYGGEKEFDITPAEWRALMEQTTERITIKPRTVKRFETRVAIKFKSGIKARRVERLPIRPEIAAAAKRRREQYRNGAS